MTPLKITPPISMSLSPAPWIPGIFTATSRACQGCDVCNYAVLGIPTLLLLDANGIVQEKSARVDEGVDGIDDGVAKQ
jgi:hypothetical protein